MSSRRTRRITLNATSTEAQRRPQPRSAGVVVGRFAAAAIVGVAVAAVVPLHAANALEPSPSGAVAMSATSSGMASSTAGVAPLNDASAGVATVPPKTPTEKKAARLSAEALGANFKAGRFIVSEEKLREAIRICGPGVCSTAFQARLHRDLAYVYVDGFLRIDDGRDEFTAALSLDATVALTAPMQTSTAIKAFSDAKARLSGGAPKKVEPADVTLQSAPPEPPTSNDNPDESYNGGRLANWVMLSIEQDLVFHSPTADACGAGSRYECFDVVGNRQPISIGTILPGGSQVIGGDQISGSGALPGTLRILVGYERVVHPNVTVGVRLGSVITGKPRHMDTDTPFLFFHGEGRVSLWIGHDVFSHSGLRPYVFLSGGVAEAAGKITVDYTVSNDPQTYKLDAWKRSGHSFIGPGLGAQVAFTKSGGPFAELRFMQFMSPNVPVIAFQLGYAVGF